jgi:hypothetical protein
MLRVNCQAVMWKITTRGFTLEEVLIMAAMNLSTSTDTSAKTRETGVAEMKKRSKMDLNSIKRTILAAVGVLALSSVNAVAQEIRSKISLQGTGFFTKDADGKGIATRDRHWWIPGWLSLQLQSLACSRGKLRI